MGNFVGCQIGIPSIAVTREGDPSEERKRFITAKHIPQNERPTHTNSIAAPGGVTAIRGGFALIPRKKDNNT